MSVPLKRGSWRGVAMPIKGYDDAGGGHNIIHEFAGDLPAQAEPMGSTARRISIEVVYGGDGATDAASMLREQLDIPGPGKLLHPRRGEINAALAEPYREVESVAEGGIVRFSLVFVEVGDQPQAAFSLDTAGLVRSLASQLSSALRPRLFDLSGPNFIGDAVNAVLAGPRSVTATLASLNNRISQTLGSIDSISNAIDDFRDELTTLINSPTALWIALKGLQNSLFSLLDVAGFDTSSKRGNEIDNLRRSKVALAALTTLGTFGDGQADVAPITGNRRKQRDNQRELIDLVEVSGLAGGVAAIADLPIDNPVQAEEIVEQVGAIFDRIQERGTIDDDIDQRMRTLRSAFYEHMRAQAVTTPALARYTPQVTQPALCIAYDLYGDATRDQEIIDRNDLAHPLFVDGSVELQVAGV